jgi:hypothetical protein
MPFRVRECGCNTLFVNQVCTGPSRFDGPVLGGLACFGFVGDAGSPAD